MSDFDKTLHAQLRHLIDDLTVAVDDDGHTRYAPKNTLMFSNFIGALIELMPTLAARAQPAQVVPLLTDEEIRQVTQSPFTWDNYRAVEQAVRAKMGVAVPMTKRVHKSNGGGAVHPALLSTDEWFEFWNTNDNVDGESIFPEFLYLAQDIEQAVLTKVGIVGKEGGNDAD